MIENNKVSIILLSDTLEDLVIDFYRYSKNSNKNNINTTHIFNNFEIFIYLFVKVYSINLKPAACELCLIASLLSLGSRFLRLCIKTNFVSPHRNELKTLKTCISQYIKIIKNSQ